MTETAEQEAPALPIGTIVQLFIDAEGAVRAEDPQGNNVTVSIPYHIKNKTRQLKEWYTQLRGTAGGQQWRTVDKADFIAASQRVTVPTFAQTAPVENTENEDSDEDSVIAYPKEVIREIIQKSLDLKPDWLIFPETDWKLGVRTVLRGGRLLFIGDSGYGKTEVCKQLAAGLGRPYFEFHLNAENDPRGFIIGQTHAGDGRTYLVESAFLRAIQTPGAVINLDEIGRAKPDVANALLTVLSQGFVRLNEDPTTPVYYVADGVAFLATANVGNQYTMSEEMDRALLDRFMKLPVNPPPYESEVNLLTTLYPDTDTKQLTAICKLAQEVRDNVRSDSPRLSKDVSTRVTLQMAALLDDGFTLDEVFSCCFYSAQSTEGGNASELTFARQVGQQYIDLASGKAMHRPSKMDDDDGFDKPF